MTFGVFVATFSSIYVAGPLLLWIESRYPRGAEESRGRAVQAEAEAPARPATRRPERAGAR
jgi:preprotein translocase subunit SecF